jgi:soluble lytic murein transglycosylase
LNKQDRYDSLIQYYSEEYGLDWLKVKAQIKAESAFDPDAISLAKAIGLAQFMRGTWEEWKDGKVGISDIVGEDYSRNNPEHSIRSMCAYLNWLTKYYHKVLENLITRPTAVDESHIVLASYNWGIGAVKKHIKQYGYLNRKFIPEETNKYIDRIEEFYLNYKKKV